MGKSLYDSSEAAKKVFDAAGDQIKYWCFEGTKEMLRETNITQPSVYTVTMAAYEAFLEAMDKADKDFWSNIQIVGISGFSLGEYAALTAAGTIDDLQKGIDIVIKRGNLMGQAGVDENGNPKGSMTAAFGERSEILECVELSREDGILEAVNFNSPVQTVVAGDFAALERFKEVAGQRKIKARPLSVSTAFHSPMMAPAANALKDILIDAGLKSPGVKVYSNVTAKDMMEGYGGPTGAESEFISDLMAKQAMSPVYWQEIVENMAADGAEILIEIGPGTTLSGIVKKVNSEILTLNIEDLESLEKTISVLEERLHQNLEGENVC